jgi:glycosyltransferase involved in cell wall biosynthesis
VFVLPSAYETFSLATFEAAASGLPLLVTKVSGVEDVLAEGVNGWYIERESQLIRPRLHQLMVHKEMRELMGTKSREAVAQYSWSRMANSDVSLYGKLGEGSARREAR